MNAPDKAVEIKAAITGVLVFITTLIGPAGWLVLVWLFSMVMDYATGSLSAYIKGDWDSAVAREGVYHKLGSIEGVLVAVALDVAFGVILPELGIEYKIKIMTPTVCLWYLITELGSIVENIDKLGAPVPDFLRKALRKVKSEVDKTGNAITDTGNEEDSENEEVSEIKEDE